MSIVSHIVDLNCAAMIGGTKVERFYATPQEFDAIYSRGLGQPSLSELQDIAASIGFQGWTPKIRGFVDGVAIIVK